MSVEWKQYSAADFRKTLENISLLEKTGVLEIQDNSTHKEPKSYFFFISNGEILYIKENPVDSDNRIGNVLISRDYISHDQLSDTLKMQHENQYEFLGDILMKQGYITPNELLETLTYQIENMIFQIAFVTDGRFSFSEGKIPQRMPQIPYTITLSNLLMIFISSCDLSKNHPHISGTFEYTYSISQDLKTTSESSLEGSIIALFSKRKNIKGIFEALPFHNHLSLLKTILSLEERGILRKRETPLIPPGKNAKVVKPEPEPEFKHTPAVDPDLSKAVNDAMNQLVSQENLQTKKTKQRKSAKPKRPISKPAAAKEGFHKKTVPVKQRSKTTPVKIKKPAPTTGMSKSTPPHSPLTYITAKALSFMFVFVLLSIYISILHPVLSRMLIKYTLFTTESFDIKAKTEYTIKVLNRIQAGETDILTDGWGNIIEIRNGRAVSPGPDRLFDTDDDLRR